MLITKDSILNKIPVNLDQRQVFLLEGIKYCANSISLSYISLFNEIEYISSNSLREHSCSLIFKEAWNQIDSTYRLTNLLSAISNKNPNQPAKQGENFEFLLQTKSFRNTFQHLDERIDELMLELNAPVWGNISWVKVINQTTVKSYVLSAGQPRNNFASGIINPAGKELRTPIDLITIEAIQKKANEPVSIINLTELYSRTEFLIKKLSEELEPQLSPFLDSGVLPQEMMITLDIEFDN